MRDSFKKIGGMRDRYSPFATLISLLVGLRVPVRLMGGCKVYVCQNLGYGGCGSFDQLKSNEKKL